MIEIDIEERFKNKIDEIWERENFKIINLQQFGYSVQKNLAIQSILFVGINPSNSDNSFKKEFYYSPQDASHHKYFKKFNDVSKKVNLHWTHVDLLFIRKTEQKMIERIEQDYGQTGMDFISEQLNISKEIIELSQPKIIVVNNTLARKYLGEKSKYYCGFQFTFNHELGTYLICNSKKLENVPVFFTSMLTGQRALDNGSYERLIWHIQFVLNKLNDLNHSPNCP